MIIKKNEEDRLDRELRLVIEQKRKRALEGFSRLSSEGEVIGAYDRSS
jgi:hypothetical protein